jgi:hypothetical protein
MAWAIFNQGQGIALEEIEDDHASDRIVAIVGAAILDESLMRTLELRFRMGTNTKDKIFKLNGALGNLGPKIDMAYLLYMFEKQTREALYGISEIRNFFAHNLVAGFDSKEKKFTESINKLKLHEGRSYYPNPFTKKDSEVEIGNPSDARAVFIVNLKLALIELLADVSKHQHGSNLPL